MIPLRVFGITLFLTLCLCALTFSFAFAAPEPGKGLENPLNFKNIQEFVEGVLRATVMIALPIITIFIVYAGFLFIKARGNSSDLSEAKKNFQYVILGTIMILSAWVLATLIGSTVTQILG